MKHCHNRGQQGNKRCHPSHYAGECGHFGERRVRNKVIFFFPVLSLHITHVILSQKAFKTKGSRRKGSKMVFSRHSGRRKRGVIKVPPRSHSCFQSRQMLGVKNVPFSPSEPYSTLHQGLLSSRSLTIQTTSKGEC